MSTPPLDPPNANELARLVQHEFPLVARPFAVLATKTGQTEAAVIAQLRRWSDDGLLREISAVIEGSAVGYDSALVAGRIPVEEIDRVAEIVNRHPTVTHNYLREHAYNLWFTIAVPHSMGLEAHLRALAEQSGVETFHPLRRTHTFKIGVNFDLDQRQNRTSAHALHEVDAVELTGDEQRIVRALQTPLPLEERPFATLATLAGTDEETLLSFATRHHGEAIRKYVATFRHRRLGVRGNGMVVWNVDPARFDALGPRLAQAPEVSHCYARNGIEGFPYTLYSMIHGPDSDACRMVARRLSSELGIDDYLILFSTHEYKKCRLRYFLPELDAWWSEANASRKASA